MTQNPNDSTPVTSKKVPSQPPNNSLTFTVCKICISLDNLNHTLTWCGGSQIYNIILQSIIFIKLVYSNSGNQLGRDKTYRRRRRTEVKQIHKDQSTDWIIREHNFQQVSWPLFVEKTKSDNSLQKEILYKMDLNRKIGGTAAILLCFYL